MTIQHRTVEIEAASKPWKDALCGLHRLQGASVCLPTSSLDRISKSRVVLMEAASSQIADRTSARELRGRTRLQCATASPIP
ncbi:hypothetical protein ACVII0_005936 [Sinorhizobium meliloti]